MEAGDQLAITCPACSPSGETAHEVLRSGGQPTVRCRACGHVHATTAPETPTEVSLRTIISQDGESITARLSAPEEAILEVGDRFVVDADEAVYSVELASIEDAEGTRHDRHEAGSIETLWTRDIGNVTVNVTIHPAAGSQDDSRSATHQLPGDTALSVGDELTIDDEPVRITGLLRRDSTVAAGSPRRLDEPGDRARAMNLDRIYARSRNRVHRDPW